MKEFTTELQALMSRLECMKDDVNAQTKIGEKLLPIERTDIRYDSSGAVVKYFESPDLTCLNQEIYKWRSNTPVVIAAGTGAGKTTWVLDVLLKKVANAKKKMLYLTNRAALNEQIKRKLIENVKEYMPLAQYNLLEKQLINALQNNDNGVCEMGPVVVMTLQAYYKADKESDMFEDISTVVVDEAHYFMSDAIFNLNTAACFKSIFNRFTQAVKLFVTATPDNILPEIIKKGYDAIPGNLVWSWSNAGYYLPYAFDIRGCNTIYNVTWNEYLNEYSYECGYANLGTLVYIFSDNGKSYKMKALDDVGNIAKSLEPLIKKIKDTKDGKAILFIDNKTIGRKIADEFGKDALFISAETKYEGENSDAYVAYKRLLINEKFAAHKVLICTSALDNGINIEDADVGIIFIDADDKVKFQQMLGRIRFPRAKGKSYEPEVWFINYGREHFCQKLKQAKEQLKELVELDKLEDMEEKRIYFNWCLKKERTFPMQIGLKVNGDIAYNIFAIYELKRMVQYYGDVIARIDGKVNTEALDIFDYRKFLVEHYKSNLMLKYPCVRAKQYSVKAPCQVINDMVKMCAQLKFENLVENFKKKILPVLTGKNVFCDYVASWFWRRYEIDKLENDNTDRKELEKYLESIAEVTMKKSEQEEFCTKLNNFINKITGGSVNKIKQLNKLNEWLKEQNFEFKITSKQIDTTEGQRPTVWIVQKTNNNFGG